MSFPAAVRVAIVSLAVLGASSALAQGLSQPTKFHQALAREVGVWNATAKLWASPNAEPMLSTGKETCEMLGGFWLTSKYEGKFFGMPYTGQGATGYDTQNNEYVSTWIDSMTSDLVVSRGQYDVKTHTLTLLGKGRDAQTGELESMKMTIQYPDADHKTMAMYHAGESDGEWVKSLEIEYERAE